MKGQDVKQSQLHLQRLFAAARAVPAPPVTGMPPYLANRVLAHWRQSATQESAWFAMAYIFPRALVCAGVVMFLTVAWSYMDLTGSRESVEALATYEMTSNLSP